MLENDEIRGLIDNRSETIGRKIRDAEIDKIPFMLVVGEKESKQEMISVRSHGGKDFGVMKLEKGDACLFAPNLLHRVKPVIKGVRHSVVSWFILRELGDVPTKELQKRHAGL